MIFKSSNYYYFSSYSLRVLKCYTLNHILYSPYPRNALHHESVPFITIQPNLNVQDQEVLKFDLMEWLTVKYLEKKKKSSTEAPGRPWDLV